MPAGRRSNSGIESSITAFVFQRARRNLSSSQIVRERGRDNKVQVTTISQSRTEAAAAAVIRVCVSRCRAVLVSMVLTCRKRAREGYLHAHNGVFVMCTLTHGDRALLF